MRELSFILFFSLFIFLNQYPCAYYKSEDGSITDTEKDDPLEGITNENEQKQKCYSYSYSDIFQNKCCYDSAYKQCYKWESAADDENCPKDSVIFNNCGMAGIYQPITNTTCTEISLVQGYCCYASFNDGSTACIRTKELNKEKNSETKDMTNYLGKIISQYQTKKDIKFDKIVCKGYNLKYYSLFLILLFISL